MLVLGVVRPSAARSAPIPRKILVLYGEGQSERENPIFQYAGPVLHYFGLLPEYRDARTRPLPDDHRMADVRAVVITLQQSLKKGRLDYLRWLLHQMDQGRKLVILGQLGVPPETAHPEEQRLRREIWKRLGIRQEGFRAVPRFRLRYTLKDPDMVEYEREYPPYPSAYYQATIVDPRLTPHLVVDSLDGELPPAALVGTHPNGGFALPGTFLWFDPETFTVQWYIDPFRFFSESLDLDRVPAPDPTTLNGMRVAFSHIDGDAFGGHTDVPGYRTCAEVIRDEILKKFDFPVSVSVITAEVDPSALGSPYLRKLAREIFRLPNVEPASHSFSHPFYWDPNYVYKSRYHRLHGLVVPGYRFDPRVEILGSVSYISEDLAPPDKPCRLFFWTGNCEPLPSDLALCDRAGILNINGGDTLLDSEHPSLSFVSPLFWVVGGHVQVLTGQANENILTNLWKGPYFGFRNIIETMKRTEEPRRLKPIDIYYHFYSGQYEASLNALKEVYTWALQQDIAPVFTSRYIQMVKDFRKVRFFRQEDGAIAVEDYGTCLTVRLHSSQGIPDLIRSRNVIGYDRHDDWIYVSLQPGAKRAVIAMKTGAEAVRAFVPYVKKASGRVRVTARNHQALKMEVEMFGSGRVILGGLPPHRFVTLRGSALSSPEKTRTADSNGNVVLQNVGSGSLHVSWE